MPAYLCSISGIVSVGPNKVGRNGSCIVVVWALGVCSFVVMCGWPLGVEFIWLFVCFASIVLLVFRCCCCCICWSVMVVLCAAWIVESTGSKGWSLVRGISCTACEACVSISTSGASVIGDAWGNVLCWLLVCGVSCTVCEVGVSVGGTACESMAVDDLPCTEFLVDLALLAISLS